MRQPSILSERHQFPGEIISHTVWRYFRFLLSYGDVEELLAERGIALRYETVRHWCRTFGQGFADGLRRRRSRPGDTWHGDEVQLKSNGRKHRLWRAVDQAGIVLDILVQPRRNQKAAAAFPRRVVEGNGYRPRVMIMDTLASYPPALRHVLPGVEHRRHNGSKNRAENSHRPIRRRERVLQRFKLPDHAQRFLAPFRPVATSCPPLNTTSCCRPASPPGAESPGCSLLPEQASRHSPRRRRSFAAANPVTLTIPPLS